MRRPAKIATDALCEIMRDSGHACCEESACWKKAECNEAQHMVRAFERAQATNSEGGAE